MFNPRWSSFFQLTKPRLNFLVLLSALASYDLALVSGPRPWGKMLEAAAAIFALAGGSAALNMWLEREHDARMKRTQKRPLAAGLLSPAQGLAFGIALSAAALLWLALRVNSLTAWLGLLTWGSYLFIYTPLKRVTPLATLVGAVPGALPPVMGWTSAGGSLGPEALALFVILFLWQVPHFLAIAVMYREDYEAAGFKMLPAKLGGELAGRQMIIYALALVPATLWIQRLGMSGMRYFSAALFLGLAYTAVALAASVAARQNERAGARRLLLMSVIYLPLLFAAMLADRIR